MKFQDLKVVAGAYVFRCDGEIDEYGDVKTTRVAFDDPDEDVFDALKPEIQDSLNNVSLFREQAEEQERRTRDDADYHASLIELAGGRREKQA